MKLRTCWNYFLVYQPLLWLANSSRCSSVNSTMVHTSYALISRKFLRSCGPSAVKKLSG
jgi:hypothetical protein